ncbi:hypothetical protein K9B32_22725 [Rhizobium sp. 3T7]|uniref:hypothetical protein n=1 Tax=Rhizobium sp. 3T7 TaxID=2874922 RepID=UPI001CCAADA5|nr:hypothetical protein [Rhizobium sp. 3T7]MBZ9792889.1 hypothetical protein [Rhizobium sp. 3T7]
MALGTSHRLQDGVEAVEAMTRFAFAILALASGVYTYLGVRSILDGSAAAVFFAALIYSSAVSVAIYAFWTYMARFYPHVTGTAGRTAMLGVMALGCAMIIAMSSWLNAAALAGSAALEQHLAETLEDYTADLDQAHQNALAAQSLLPDIQRTQERFQRLADQERETGALTGTTGAGSVVQLLSQMASQLTELENGINASRERVTTLFDEGRKHLETMRTLVSAPGAINPRADQFSAEVVGLSGVITSLEQTSIAPSVKRAAEDLSLGFIAPVADGRQADLATRQDQVMETIRSSVAAQSKVLSQAADQILERKPVAERRFVPLSSAEAVLRYAGDFIPSWAGAISIDILPAVLIFMLSIVHSTLRRQEQRLPFAERITAAELLQALEVQREVRRHGVDIEAAMDAAERTEPADQSNIASFDLSGKGPRKGPPA